MKRLLLALLATAVALLLVEGALSLAAHRSLTELIGSPGTPARPAPGRAPPPNPKGTLGLYRVHPDPRVGYVLKADAELAIWDGEIHSDTLGMRRRALPSRGPGALRIAVLGDSVAFGYGLDDDETLAHHLELLLNAAGAAGAARAAVATGDTAATIPPVECQTVAIPGWNHRNAVFFLLDHLDAIDPDIVVYLPLPNDLLDSDGVDEIGKRRMTLDLGSGEPWLSVNQLSSLLFARNAANALKEAGKNPWAWIGPDVIQSDLSPESHRRFDENVESIKALARTIKGRGGRLLLLQWVDDEYGWALRRRFAEQRIDLPVLPLLTNIPAELTLGFDPHPNAETVEGLAAWVAGDLLARGWVAGDPAVIPRAAEAVEADRGPDRPLAEAAAKSTQFQWSAWARLQPVIDFQTHQGVGQIFGGINIDGTAGARALFLLPRGADTLSVRLAGLAERPDLYPMDVAVQLDGRFAGLLRLEVETAVEASFDVPAQPPPALPIEVRLIPERFGVLRSAQVGWQLVSFRPLRLQCGTPGPEDEVPAAERPPAGTLYPMR